MIDTCRVSCASVPCTLLAEARELEAAGSDALSLSLRMLLHAGRGRHCDLTYAFMTTAEPAYGFTSFIVYVYCIIIYEL